MCSHSLVKELSSECVYKSCLFIEYLINVKRISVFKHSDKVFKRLFNVVYIFVIFQFYLLFSFISYIKFFL